MKAKSLILAALLATLSGCVNTTKTVPFSTTTKFDSAQAQAMLDKGKNSLRGSAVIRQGGGGVVTCAGSTVGLVPATAYTDERIRALYGNIDRGYNPLFGGRELNVKNEDPQYQTLFKQTTCDAQGFFKFNNLADGSFYVISPITWEVPGAGVQGGTLMQRVTVKGGETKEIVLAP